MSQAEENGLFRFDDPENNRIVIRVAVKERPPLETWALMVGDCVHACRTALDHAVWQLTGQTFDTHDTQTQFPVFDDRRKFRDFGERYIQRIKGRRERAIIKWLQPYRRPEPDHDLLNLLHQLDIADKHKVVGVHAVIPDHFDVSASTVGDTCVSNPIWTFDRACSFEDGAEAAWFTWDAMWSPAGAEVGMDVKSHLTVDVVFSQDVPAGLKGHTAIPVLYQLLGRATKILRALIPPDGDAEEMLRHQELPPPLT